MAKPIPLSGGRKILPTREDLERLPASFFGFGKKRSQSSFSVSGTIVDDGAQALSGVTVQLKDGATVVDSTTTDANGAYSFSGVSAGDYRILPTLAGYTIAPTHLDITVAGASLTEKNFVGTEITYSVSGTIIDDGAQSLYGVTVQLKQGATIIASTSTNEEGAYSFAAVSPGSYRILPTLAAYTMAPTYLDVTVVAVNLTEKNFVGTLITFEVSGQILDSAGAGLDGVTVSIPAIAPVVTAGGGLYSFDLPPGEYTLTPTLAGSTFLPTSRDIEVIDDDVVVDNMQQVWTISGVIQDADEVGFEDVTVTLSGDDSDSTTTDGTGAYSFPGLVDGSYTVTPTKVGSVFSADHEDVNVAGDDVVVDTMIQVWRIYGVVVDGADNPIENVLMTMTEDEEDTTTTNASGEWEFYIGNREVTVTPSLAGRKFSPADQNFDIQGADEEAADFVGAYWPLIWNVEEQANGALTHCTSQNNVTVGAVPFAVVPASITKSAYFNASTEHFILDMGAANAIPNTGSFRAEALCVLSGTNPTYSVLQFFVNNPVDNYGRIDIAHKLSSVLMHNWDSGTGGTGTDHGAESVSWGYGSPLGLWCCHQMEVNLATNSFKSRILARGSGNQGTQDSGWKTRVFSPAIAESPFRYIRCYAYSASSVSAWWGQIWVGNITDSFPDGALLTNNFTP